MKIHVRPATKTDTNSIAGFQVAMASETEGKHLDLETVETAVGAVFKDPNKGFYLVAESNDAVVASLLITYEWSDWRNCNLWYFQSVFVKQEHRGQGVFKDLYGVVMNMAKDAGIQYVRLYVETENDDAQKVYQSLGMKRMPYFMYDARVQ